MHVFLAMIKTTLAVVQEGSLYGLTHSLLLKSIWPRRHGDQKLRSFTCWGNLHEYAVDSPTVALEGLDLPKEQEV